MYSEDQLSIAHDFTAALAEALAQATPAHVGAVRQARMKAEQLPDELYRLAVQAAFQAAGLSN